MLLLVLFRVPFGGRAITSIETIPEGLVQSLRSDPVRDELLPLLPGGTTWPAGRASSEWNGADGNRFEFEVTEGSVGIRAHRFDGELLDALRRIHATDRWIITSTETAELFDFGRPE